MINKLKKVTLNDVLGIFKFLILIIPAFFYKLYLKLIKKELWLVCETKLTARDNGYVFYKYLKENHPEIKSFYAISYNCPDYDKVKSLGNIAKWSSLKHYFLYMSSTKNISSHKEGNPNHSLFTVLHLYLNLYNNRVFLQHGVLYQNFDMFHKCNTKFCKFVCGAKPEFDFVKSKYGYSNEVIYTGLARFDNLYNFNVDKDIILYMPTWRRWLDSKEKLESSKYFKNIMNFINSKKLNDYLVKNNKKLLFCPHGGLRNFRSIFKTNNSNVEIVDISTIDIQELLKKGALLITDFSSIHTDFAYMFKPIIYYQYDEKDYKEKHIGNSAYDTYFSFDKNAFGKVVNNEEDLLTEIKKIVKNNFVVEKKYLNRINSFFKIRDNKNCERIFNEIINK